VEAIHEKVMTIYGLAIKISALQSLSLWKTVMTLKALQEVQERHALLLGPNW
jgi:hypothetical protein